VIDDGVDRDRMLIGPQERDARRVGAPPERAMRAAAEDLLFVDPIELAVQDERRAVGRQRALVAGEVGDIEVVAPDTR
jgi:hypothetical protein